MLTLKNIAMSEQESIPINNELDIVIARQKGREIAKNFGFASIDLALIATAISDSGESRIEAGDR